MDKEWATKLILDLFAASVPSDVRPISVVSILSMVMECLIIHKYVHRLWLVCLFAVVDEYVFKPTGFIIMAIIALLQRTKTILLTNNFVLLILTFQKHLSLFAKNWLTANILLALRWN